LALTYRSQLDIGQFATFCKIEKKKLSTKFNLPILFQRKVKQVIGGKYL